MKLVIWKNPQIFYRSLESKLWTLLKTASLFQRVRVGYISSAILYWTHTQLKTFPKIKIQKTSINRTLSWFGKNLSNFPTNLVIYINTFLLNNYGPGPCQNFSTFIVRASYHVFYRTLDPSKNGVFIMRRNFVVSL